MKKKNLLLLLLLFISVVTCFVNGGFWAALAAGFNLSMLIFSIVGLWLQHKANAKRQTPNN